MIVKTRKGYQVKSEAGKPLSKDDLTHEEAQARLAEVERFKGMEKDVGTLKAWAKKRK
jgi:hypothetical protein